jgi:GNAT superfamily N-acetyltransferase
LPDYSQVVDTQTAAIRVRPAGPADAHALNSLLNIIIRKGGTTAYETAFSEAEFGEHFLAGPSALRCLVAEQMVEKSLLGFQTLVHSPNSPPRCCDIATFARPEPKTPGTGALLFAATVLRDRELGLRSINATIRRDNIGGRAFYEKMGFHNYRIDKAVPLEDGTPVDRISKRFFVG